MSDDELEELYRRNLPRISNLIRMKSGNNEDAKDILQEAVFIIWEKVSQNRLELTASIDTYLYSVCNNLWRKELRRRGNFPKDELTGNEEIADDAEVTLEKEIALSRRQKIAAECISKLGETCKAIIQYFYIDRLSMIEIAVKVGLKNDDVAKNMKSRCKQKLEECVRQNNK